MCDTAGAAAPHVMTRAALEQAEAKAAEDALPAPGNVVALAGRR